MPGPSSPRDLRADDIMAAVSGEPTECAQEHRPRTEEGKRISRRNALRHGLTAETVIDVLEDSEDYRGSTRRR
jgi:hypothetical protein